MPAVRNNNTEPTTVAAATTTTTGPYATRGLRYQYSAGAAPYKKPPPNPTERSPMPPSAAVAKKGQKRVQKSKQSTAAARKQLLQNTEPDENATQEPEHNTETKTTSQPAVELPASSNEAALRVTTTNNCVSQTANAPATQSTDSQSKEISAGSLGHIHGTPRRASDIEVVQPTPSRVGVQARVTWDFGTPSHAIHGPAITITSASPFVFRSAPAWATSFDDSDAYILGQPFMPNLNVGLPPMLLSVSQTADPFMSNTYPQLDYSTTTAQADRNETIPPATTGHTLPNILPNSFLANLHNSHLPSTTNRSAPLPAQVSDTTPLADNFPPAAAIYHVESSSSTAISEPMDRDQATQPRVQPTTGHHDLPDLASLHSAVANSLRPLPH